MAASPRRHGNTETLLDSAVKGAEECGVRVVRAPIGHIPFNPCLACDGCFADGECVQKDEMQSIYPHLIGAAGVILAAPIFSMHINAQAKAMIDRCQRFWATKYVLKRDVVAPELRPRRRGIFLSVCGRDDPRIFDCTVPTLSYFFHVLEVPVWERLTYHNVDARGAIAKHATALADAATAGARMANSVNETRPGA